MPSTLWLLQLDGVTGGAALQVQATQRELDATGTGTAAVRSLGLDGLVLIRTATDQSYSSLSQALSGIPGYRYVGDDHLGSAVIFAADPSSPPLSQVPGEWVAHFDGFSGTPAAQEHLLQLYLDGTGSGARVERQLGRDGVFAIRTAPGLTLAEFDSALRAVPGYRYLEANPVGWVTTYLATKPGSASSAVPGEWIAQFSGMTGNRLEQMQQIQKLLDAAGAGATVTDQLGADGLVTISTDPGRSYEDLDRALEVVSGFQSVSPNFTVQTAATGGQVLVTAADGGGGPQVVIRTDTNGDGTADAVTASFFAFDPGFRGGVRVALGDFDGDGRDELVTAAGPGGGPHVEIWNLDASGAVTGLRDSFFAFDPAFRGGVWVATGDFDRDGKAELVVSADAGGGPHVKIFSDTNGDGRVSDNLTDSFFAFDPAFRGGVRIAVGNFDGSRDRLVVAAGPGGAPVVNVYDNGDLNRRVSDDGVLGQFNAFDPGFTGGVYIATDPFGNSRASPGNLLVGAGAGGGPQVRLFRASLVENIPPLQPGELPLKLSLHEQDSFFAYDPGFRGGVRVAFVDLTPTDPSADVATAAGSGGGSHVKIWSGDAQTGKVSDQPPDDSFDAFPGFTGGVFIASGTT